MLDICVTDPLYIFRIAAVLNAILFFATFISWNSEISRVAFALDSSIMLKMVIETAIGDNMSSNVMVHFGMLACFACFFYVMAPMMFGVLFLILGLILVQDVWNPFAEQLSLFLNQSFNLVVDVTHTKALFAGLILTLLLIMAFSVAFRLTFVQITTLSFIQAVKLITSWHILRLPTDKICCSKAAEPDNCPYWWDLQDWIKIMLAFVFRIMWGQWLNPKWRAWRLRREGFQKIPQSETTQAQTTDNATTVEMAQTTDSKVVDSPAMKKKKKRYTWFG